jgi:hypothetical protein
MRTLTTNNFKVELAKEVYDLLDLGINNSLPTNRKKFFYAVLARQAPWPNEQDPPVPTQGTNCLNIISRNSLYAKRLNNSEASFVTKRINWQSGIVYTPYSDLVCNFDGEPNFYVLTSSYEVFKCLDNNNGVPSIEQPDITLSTTSLEEPYVQTSDGYKWKYLYTLTSIQIQKYLTNEWMPVTKNKFVSTAAVNGSIDVVRVINSGNNYVNGSTQSIITVQGDGTGAVFRANVVGGQIKDVVIQNRGRNYTYADLTVRDVTGGNGSGAQLEVSISPQNGHGFDPVYELNASAILFDSDFSGDDNVFLSENDYRQIYIVLNPLEQSTNNIATGEKYSLMHRIKTSPGLGDFNEDEVVYQGNTFETSTFTANVVYFDSVQNYLYVNNVIGNLSVNQAIKGQNTGSIRVLIAFDLPTLKLYTGKMLYISNGLTVSRNPDQTDRIRFILNFET